MRKMQLNNYEFWNVLSEHAFSESAYSAILQNS